MKPEKEPPSEATLCAKCGLTRGTLIHRPPEFEDMEGAEDCHPFEPPSEATSGPRGGTGEPHEHAWPCAGKMTETPFGPRCSGYVRPPEPGDVPASWSKSTYAVQADKHSLGAAGDVTEATSSPRRCAAPETPPGECDVFEAGENANICPPGFCAVAPEATSAASEPQCRFCGGFRYHARDCSYAQPGTVIPKFGPETGKTTDPICDNCGSNLAMGNKYGDYHVSGRCRGPNPTPPEVQTASSESPEQRARVAAKAIIDAFMERNEGKRIFGLYEIRLMLTPMFEAARDEARREEEGRWVEIVQEMGQTNDQQRLVWFERGKTEGSREGKRAAYEDAAEVADNESKHAKFTIGYRSHTADAISRALRARAQADSQGSGEEK